MTIDRQSRRSVLIGIVGGVCATTLLPGCATENSKGQEAIESILKLLRHQGVAAHLGRLEVEANPELQSLTLEQLGADLLSAIGLDIDNITDNQIDTIHERLSIKIRQDFSDEAITTVDGWLLSATEAKACALVYLKIT